MPYLRYTLPADSPAACSFKTLMTCSSVTLLLRIVRLPKERTPPKNRGHLRGAGQRPKKNPSPGSRALFASALATLSRKGRGNQAARPVPELRDSNANKLSAHQREAELPDVVPHHVDVGRRRPLLVR